MTQRLVIAAVVAMFGAFAHGCSISENGLAASGDNAAGATSGSAPVSVDGGSAGTTGDSGTTAGGSGGGAGTGGVMAAGGAPPLDVDLTPDAPVLPCEGATGTGKAPGAACACAGECAAGFCVDGVCCEEACVGGCRSCTPASKGRCVFTPSGGKDDRNQCAAQPASTCNTTGLCDGQGGCAKHPQGAVCADALDCEGTRYPGPARCDGKGTCAAAVQIECSPFLCSARACLTRCNAAKDCASGLTCINGNCEGLRGNAATCTAATQCATGFCVKGVCCSEACLGECRSCGLPGSQGQCRLVPAGQTAPAGECAAQSSSTCGRSGACDGQGHCALHAAGTSCAAASCSSGSQRASSTCEGFGSCVPGATKNCEPYTCGGAATCLDRCSGDGGCLAGTICVLGMCQNFSVLDVPFAAVAPTADGKLEAAWRAASPPQSIDKLLVGSAAKFSAEFRALWSQAGLHLLVVVEDTNLKNDSAGQGSFDDDTVEVYVDADGSRGTNLDNKNDHHILFGWNDTEPQNVSLRRTDGIGFGQSKSGAGYLMELTLPWSTLATTASAGKLFGLDVHVNDDDDGGPRERKYAAFATQDVSFRDPSTYGRVRLLP